MYIANHFSVSEVTQLSELMRNYPFVAIISKDESGNLSISHVPVVVEFENNELKSIKGHFAIRNPQVGHLRSDNRVTVIFNGPQTYITPTWYRSGRDVPTWNYCVVHVQGQLLLQPTYAEIIANLQELTDAFESGPKAWKFELPPDLNTSESLTAAIVAFTVNPEKIEAKFKLSQNRPAIDRTGIIEGLGSRTDEMSRGIQKYMLKHEA